MGQQRAPVALLQPQPPQVRPRHLHLVEQLPGRDRDRLTAPQFLENNVVATLLQAGKNLFKK